MGAKAEMETPRNRPSMFQTKSEASSSVPKAAAPMSNQRSDYMQFLVSAKVAKIIIGVNGYTVRQIERQSGCTVQVKRDGQGGPTAIVSLLGNHQAACQVIEEFLRREGC